MSRSFNLISDPWIPCIDLEGRERELNLGQTLARAHRLREILDNSPLVTVSLHRFLLAILHRYYGPKNEETWIALWQQGRFDGAPLESYWERWRSRFKR